MSKNGRHCRLLCLCLVGSADPFSGYLFGVHVATVGPIVAQFGTSLIPFGIIWRPWAPFGRRLGHYGNLVELPKTVGAADFCVCVRSAVPTIFHVTFLASIWQLLVRLSHNLTQVWHLLAPCWHFLAQCCHHLALILLSEVRTTALIIFGARLGIILTPFGMI